MGFITLAKLAATVASVGIALPAACTGGGHAPAPTTTTTVPAATTTAAGPTTGTVAVTLTGGFEIHANDYGRPVPLYASMLGVTAEVFRQAFSGVHPNHDHNPSADEAQRNKVALLSVLGPYGVTNDDMDRVANYYRFDSTKGQTWPHRAATALATVVDGTVTGITIVDAGSGYSYAPQATIASLPEVHLTVKLAMTRDFSTNGHVASITAG
jgi:hypothetical protein